MKPSEIKLQITRFVPASREKIFEAWTRPDRIMQWFAPGEMTTPLPRSICASAADTAFK